MGQGGMMQGGAMQGTPTPPGGEHDQHHPGAAGGAMQETPMPGG